MLLHQKKLESKQSILNRLVAIGCELFAMATTCSYAAALQKQDGPITNARELADLFCWEARQRIEANFRSNRTNQDRQKISVARKLMAKNYLWLESDIIT